MYNHAEQSRAEQSRAEQSRAEQSRAELLKQFITGPEFWHLLKRVISFPMVTITDHGVS